MTQHQLLLARRGKSHLYCVLIQNAFSVVLEMCQSQSRPLQEARDLKYGFMLHRQRRSMRSSSQPASIAALTEQDIEAIVAIVCNSSTAMPSIWGVRCQAHACFNSITMSQSLQCYTGHTGHVNKGHMICKSDTSRCRHWCEVPWTMYHLANPDNLKSSLWFLA